MKLQFQKGVLLAVASLGVLCFGEGCSRSPVLPPGVTLNVKNGEMFLALDKDAVVNVYQHKDGDRRFVQVGNLGDRLSVVQIEKGGVTPRTFDIFAASQARFSVDSGSGKEPHTIIFDEDGDGIPDLKLEGSKKYKAQVTWVEVPKTQ